MECLGQSYAFQKLTTTLEKMYCMLNSFHWEAKRARSCIKRGKLIKQNQPRALLSTLTIYAEVAETISKPEKEIISFHNRNDSFLGTFTSGWRGWRVSCPSTRSATRTASKCLGTGRKRKRPRIIHNSNSLHKTSAASRASEILLIFRRWTNSKPGYIWDVRTGG